MEIHDRLNGFGVSVSQSCVPVAKQAIARAMCRHHAKDGWFCNVIYTEISINYDVKNLDGQNKGSFSKETFHGIALIAA